MVDRFRRVLALICVAGLGLISVPAAALAAPAVDVTAEASATAAPAGSTVTVTGAVDGARRTDVVVVGRKSDGGWTELEREPVGDDAEHAFVVTPPVLGRNAYRIAVLRGARLLAASEPVVITGLIAVDPDPVPAGRSVSLTGTLPTPIARPVRLQVETDGGWQTVAADDSGEGGSVSFGWTTTQPAEVRFVAPARSVDGVTYPRFVSPTATVTVTDPGPEPTVVRAVEGLAYNARLSGDGRHILYTSDPAVTGPAVYSSGYFREDDPVRTRVVPDVGDPASSGSLGVSADGRYVLICGQPKPAGSDRGVWGLYVWDTSTDEVNRVTDFPAGTYGPLNAYLSADGSRIAFSSTQDDLVPGDTNTVADAYVIDRDGENLQRISNDADGHALASGAGVAGISADGSVVLFTTRDALDGDRHPDIDVYRFDDADSSIRLVTRPADLGEVTYYSNLVLSEDGRFVGYSANTGMLVGTSYVWDAQDGTRHEVPVPGPDPGVKRVVRVSDLSADGRYALLTYQIQSGSSVVYRWDRRSDDLQQVSGSEFGDDRTSSATSGTISDDGAVIAFTSIPTGGSFRDSAVFVWSVRD